MNRIAVVESETLERERILAVLTARGHEVRAFASRRAAEIDLRAAVPDLVLVDTCLVDGCGFDLIGSLRDAGGRRVPVIVLSNLHDEHDFVRAFAAGAVDYLVKPISRSELIARCTVQLARAGALDGAGDDVGFLPERDGLSFGRYAIVEELGRGGFGAVYLARDAERGGALAALKVLAPCSGEGSEARLRFLREIYTLSSVRDEHVARVLDVGCVQGRCFYAMEYVPGESLFARVRRAGPLDECEARLLARGLLEALRACEGVGVVHRDVKPQNVVLREGRIEAPVLVDFGLAKRCLDRGITDADAVMGTIGYLAPEVIRGRAPDGRSDMFSLGIALRFALCAEEVFPNLSGFDLLQATVAGPIPPAPVRLSAEFAAFLAALTEVLPGARPPTAGAALEALEALADVAPSPERAPNPARSADEPTRLQGAP